MGMSSHALNLAVYAECSSSDLLTTLVVITVVVLVSTSRSWDVEMSCLNKNCPCLTSVSAIYVSCRRPIFGQIMQAKIIKWVNSSVVIIADYNWFDGWINSVWQIKKQHCSIWPWSHRLVASHCTAHNTSDHERKIRKMRNEMLVFTLHCAFTANPKEITVTNCASTFDDAHLSS